MSNIKLSVIFPVRVSNNREYILDNIERIFSIKKQDSLIEYILIDSGSISYFSQKIEKICKKYKVKYIYQDTQTQVFSIGSARDYGAQLANGSCILFLDVDLVFNDLFFEKILQEIESRNLEKNVTDYFCIPCFYLDENFSKEFLEDGSLKQSNKFYQLRNAYENGDKLGIQSFAPATSLIVINRNHFLSMGGHRKEFSGHGSEDFELVHRLATYSKKYHRSYNYYLDKKNYNSIEYEGFRAYFSMAGYSVYNNNLFAVHIWHPRPKDKYQTSIGQNKELLQKFMKDFDEGKTKIEPLEDLTKEGTTLIFGRRKDKLWLGIRQILPLLGRLDYIDERQVDINNIAKFLNSRGITRLLFSNPYGNEQRLSIYRWARKNNFPYLVFERGALPDSWFIDEGFNADSESYNFEKWERSLNVEETIDIEEYMISVVQSNSTLEKNNNLRGGLVAKQEINEKYKIGNRKVLFVALQRPNDTVVKYFSGSAKSFEGFVIQVNEVVESLNEQEWFIIIKKHPLELDFPTTLKKTDNMLLIDNDYHIHDLIYIANKVLLINSGVGLLSLLFEKPVVHMGEAFYSHPKLNKYAKDSNEALDFINSDFKVSRDIRNQLIHYLKNDFYSFAKVFYSERIEKNGSKLSISENFDFYQIRGIENKYIDIAYREIPIPLSSNIYGIFLASIIREKKRNANIFVSPVSVINKILMGDKPEVSKINSKTIGKTVDSVTKTVSDSKPNTDSSHIAPSNDIKREDKNVANNETNSKVDSILEKATSFMKRTIKKRNKFARDPYNFFGDSKNPVINKGKYLYKNRKR
ncbi:glycosyltransferase [Psychrobacter glacincola]